MKTKEPPSTERYARWCGRTVNRIIIYLLPDFPLLLSEKKNLVDLYEMYVILINFSADIRKLCLLKKMSNTVKMFYIYVGL